MHNTDHLNALRFRLHNEQARLAEATNTKEIEWRKVVVSGIEKEIIAEIYFLKTKGVMVGLVSTTPTIDDILDDDLLNELMKD